MQTTNPYLDEVQRVLPRVLALFDSDPSSPTYGVGDRRYWAWKFSDFGNATFQGAAHGLARLWAAGLLPSCLSDSAMRRRIDAMFAGAARLRYRNGSLVESFPHESSFCVTALVAFDLLTAIELLGQRLDGATRDKYLDVVRPMIGFLHRAEETHAFISNHLATAAAALFKWTALTGEAGEERGRKILDRILHEQSEEGWFREYEGADPGYQTLCTYYLADLHLRRPNLKLSEPLRRSVQFLWHFAHPDGSFGGLYGSRNTRVYYPAGVAALAGEMLEARALAAYMWRSVAQRRTVTLSSIDEPNLIPMFNAYCQAATIREPVESSEQNVPCLSRYRWREEFPSAGLLVDNGPEHYTIVGLHKGGVCYHFARGHGGSFGAPNCPIIDAGVVTGAESRTPYSTQSYQPENEVAVEPQRLVVKARLVAMHKQVPTPLQFILLRVLNVSLMRFRPFAEWVKRALVRHLITGKKRSRLTNRRTIHLGPNLRIDDEVTDEHGNAVPFQRGRPFQAIHMASSGYWQVQDDAA